MLSLALVVVMTTLDEKAGLDEATAPEDEAPVEDAKVVLEEEAGTVITIVEVWTDVEVVEPPGQDEQGTVTVRVI